MIGGIKELLHFIYDVQGLISWGGLTLVCFIIFAETGLFFGFFLPGDSLLVAAGIFAHSGRLPIAWLLAGGFAAAVFGNQVGYAIGLKAGRALFSREDSIFFKRRHLLRAHDFYEKYGAKTIVLARFIPIVRTFAPPAAGAAAMSPRSFILCNILGGAGWVLATAGGGYALAGLIPHLDREIHLVIAVVIAVSILPALVEILRGRAPAI